MLLGLETPSVASLRPENLAELTEVHRILLDAEVVRRDAAGYLLVFLVVRRKVRTDDLPAMAAVGRLVNVLTSDINAIVVVR